MISEKILSTVDYILNNLLVKKCMLNCVSFKIFQMKLQQISEDKCKNGTSTEISIIFPPDKSKKYFSLNV